MRKMLYLQILSAIREERGTFLLLRTTSQGLDLRIPGGDLCRAGEDGQRIKDYACTLLGVVAANDHALCFQIGDGCIVTGDGSRYHTTFWPDQGEYANTTFLFPTIRFWSI